MIWMLSSERLRFQSNPMIYIDWYSRAAILSSYISVSIGWQHLIWTSFFSKSKWYWSSFLLILGQFREWTYWNQKTKQKPNSLIFSRTSHLKFSFKKQHIFSRTNLLNSERPSEFSEFVCVDEYIIYWSFQLVRGRCSMNRCCVCFLFVCFNGIMF